MAANPSRPFCYNMNCSSVDPEDLVESSGPGIEFRCPLCGGEVIYCGAVPAALECDTPTCPNYKLR